MWKLGDVLTTLTSYFLAICYLLFVIGYRLSGVGLLTTFNAPDHG